MSEPHYPVHEAPALSTSAAAAIFAVGILFTVLSAVAVALRFWARHIQEIRYGLDDWLILAAVPIYYIQVGLELWAVFAGHLGHHVVTYDQDVLLFKELFAVLFPYSVALLCIRLSICLLMLRIFVKKWFRIAMFVTIIVNVLWALFVVISTLAVCRPISDNWNPRAVNNPNCNVNTKKSTYLAAAAWSIVCDGMIWVLPHPVVWSLQASTAAKIRISALFALGAVGVAISCVRIAVIATIPVGPDFSWTGRSVEVWSLAEPGVGIIVACAPLFRPIFSAIMPPGLATWFRSSIRTHSSGRTGTTGTAANRASTSFGPLNPLGGSSRVSTDQSGANLKEIDSYDYAPAIELAAHPQHHNRALSHSRAKPSPLSNAPFARPTNPRSQASFPSDPSAFTHYAEQSSSSSLALVPGPPSNLPHDQVNDTARRGGANIGVHPAFRPHGPRGATPAASPYHSDSDSGSESESCDVNQGGRGM